MAHAVQSEWMFLQHVTKDMLQAFTRPGKVLRENFLPRIFFGKFKTLPQIVGDLSMLPVNKSGMGLQNPMTSVEDKYTSSLIASDDIIGAVKGG